MTIFGSEHPLDDYIGTLNTLQMTILGPEHSVGDCAGTITLCR